MNLRKPLFTLLCVFVLTASAAAESVPHWTEVRSPHFTVITDSSEKQGRHIAGQFERMRAMFHDLLPYATGDRGAEVTVLALKNHKGFEALEPAAYLRSGQLQLAGLFLPTNSRSYVLLRLDYSDEHHQYSTVYHEYTHFLMRKVEWLPLWLNEGLAEFYQNTDMYDKSVALGQPSADDILYLREQKLIPIETLLLVDHSSPYYHDDQKGSIFYAESWALTHMILMQDFATHAHRLQAYAHGLSTGMEPIAAAQQAFGDLNQLGKQLDRYVSGGDFKMMSLAKSYPVDEASFTVRQPSAAAVDAIRADVLAHDDREKEAQALDETVLREDPSNAQVHVTLGSMAMQRNDQEEAHKQFAAAVALDTNDAFAQYFYGVSTLGGEFGSGEMAKAEASLRKSIALNPAFAPAYDALAHALVINHGDLAEAHRFNVQAVQLDPTDVAYRLNAVDVLMRDHQPQSALAVLAAAKSALKSPEAQERLNARESAIQKYMAARESVATHVESASAREVSGGADGLPHGEVVVTAAAPVLPPAAKPGPHKMLHGVMHNVACLYPSGLSFELDGTSGAHSFYSLDMFKLTLTTTNFRPEGDVDPCKLFNGMKARVDYLPVEDKHYAGQVVAIELTR
ncbi:MAG: DUF1570 domain-containing protein [Acidobacteriaceae bacterium]|nr:DUF1570 domain-containing protein [Acidobacteriaceae bacterium]